MLAAPNPLRAAALAALQVADTVGKCAAAHALPGAENGAQIDCDTVFTPPSHLPARPAKPELVGALRVAQRSVYTLEGRAALLHSIAHIEFNAIDLALDIVWRFPGLPDQFYRDWVQVAKEEAKHFTLLQNHLIGMGYQYGDFAAHKGLWEMAEKTQGDVLARLALVPRTLEARGLDASPAVRDKLLAAGDQRGADILALILEEEIGHVATGNRWYTWLCAQQGLEPVAHYRALLAQHMPKAKMRGPFNLAARRAAGFGEDELADLVAI